MYTALYRAYRPEIFNEILGQDHIIKILENQLATDTVSHAYLFCGTRGTGKTTTARILAKGVNCTSEGDRPCGTCANCIAIKEGTFIDVIEIDAASNNGVENIRELRESVKFPPAAGKKKVYIVDEVHMLSTGAFNALLKTLEEPPENVMFILATTESQKLPATILSRCMRLDFKRVPEQILAGGMDRICREKGIEVSEGALKLIAANADGSVRDGLSILDQCISTGQSKIDREDILEFLGTSGEEVFLELTDMVVLQKASEALILLDSVLADGKDVRQFMKDWVSHYRNLLITKFIKKPEDILNMSVENVDRVRQQSDGLDLSDINHGIIELSKTMADAKWSTQPRILLELCIVKLSTNLVDPVSVQPRSSPPPKVQVTPAPSIPDEQQREAGQAAYDYGELWHAIFEDGETQQGSFNLIRVSTELIEIEEHEFKVAASSGVIAGYVNNNKAILEDLMEKHTGKKRTLKCMVGNEEETKGEGQDAEAIAKIAESKLGLKIEIE